MSNITSINDLWGREWQLNESLNIDNNIGICNLTTITTLPSPLATIARVRYGSVSYENGYKIERLPSVAGYVQYLIRITTGNFYICGNRVETAIWSNASNGYLSPFNNTPVVIKFEEEPVGHKLIDTYSEEKGDYTDFINWWNANTTQVGGPAIGGEGTGGSTGGDSGSTEQKTLYDQFFDLFCEIADAIREKDELEYRTIKPRKFPAEIRALGVTVSANFIEILRGEY